MFTLRCPACDAGFELSAPARPDDGAEERVEACASCGAERRWQGGILVLDEVSGAGEYPAAAYARLEAVEPRHWWYRSRNDVLSLALAGERRRRDLRSLVELGCGTGFVLAHFEAMGFDVLGLDMQIEGLAVARRRTRAPLVRSGRPGLPLAEPVDAVALCDVLEHTDEGELLTAARTALRPGGLLVVTVPARPSLWSLEDEMVGHRRRYSRRSLDAALSANGFRVVLNRPFHAVVTPLAWPAAAKGVPPREQWPSPEEYFAAGIRAPRPALAATLGAWLWLENRVGALAPLPYGSALLALAEPR